MLDFYGTELRGVAEGHPAGRPGTLTVASIEGQGTTFSLELSLAMEPA
jgi:hypothetical protein